MIEETDEEEEEEEKDAAVNYEDLSLEDLINEFETF